MPDAGDKVAAAVSDARIARRAMYRVLPRVSLPLTLGVIALVLVESLLPTATLVLTGRIVDAVPEIARGGLDSASGRRVIVAVVMLGVVRALTDPIAQVRQSVADALGCRTLFHLSHRSMAALLRPPTVDHLDDPEVADLVQKTYGAGPMGPRSAVIGLARVWSQRLQGIGPLVLLLAFHWWVPVALVATVVLHSRTLRYAHRHLVEVMNNRVRAVRKADYIRTLALDHQAAKEVRIFGLGDWLLDRMRTTWLTVVTPIWERRRHLGWTATGGSLPLIATQASALLLLAREGATGRVGVGDVAVFAGALVATSALAAVSQADSMVEYGAVGVPAVARLESKLEGYAPPHGGRSADSMPASEIRFEGVHFAYPGRDEEVFSGLDLRVDAGKSLALVGDNGAGKTTFVKLLAGLHRPTAGRILVDGVDLAEIDEVAWQRRVAAIFQDFIQFPFSAADNVTFGASGEGSDERRRKAAERAGILEVIEDLPAGWDTVLTRQVPSGVDLSGGQWQRVALARALYAAECGAGVLVLDEPTAQLDVRQEAAVYERFLELTEGVTAIVVSHRFSTVRRADRIVVFAGGRVIEDGSHDELVELGGHYAEMFTLQAARFEDPAEGGTSVANA